MGTRRSAMARNTRFVSIPPAEVWAVLADAASYAEWVVGAEDIRAADPSWPAPGATFHHTQGHWPLQIKDTSTVLEANTGRRILLEVRARPLAVARVDIALEERDGGTHVSMVETTIGGLAAILPKPLADFLVRLRNRPTLERLEALARRRGREPAAAPEIQARRA